MHMLSLDSEQAAILRDAAGAAISFLSHRIDRKDPGGFLSKSHTLQAIKMQQVIDQLDAPMVPSLAAMPARDRAQIKALAKVLATRPEAELQEAAVSKLWAALIRARLEQANDPLKVPRLPQPGVVATAPADATERA